MTAQTVNDFKLKSTIFTGLFLIFLSAFVLLSLLTADIAISPNRAALNCLTGLFGYYTAFYIKLSFGTLPSIILAFLFCLWGIQVIHRKTFFATWVQVVGGIFIISSLSSLIACITHLTLDPRLGGLLGLSIVPGGIQYLGYAGVFGASILFLFTGLFFCFGAQLNFLFKVWQATIFRLSRLLALTGSVCGWIKKQVLLVRESRQARLEQQKIREDSVALAESEEISEVIEEIREPQAKKVPRRIKRQTAVTSKAKSNRILVRNPEYTLPSIDLLEEPDTSVGEQNNTLEKRAAILEHTLSDFKIDGKVVGIECGPRVTMFEISLAPGIRVERIFALANNITMSLKAYNVRIVAPIPGKDTVGIEIPNMDNKMVGISEIFSSYDMRKNSMSAPMFLGSDITGTPIISDLAKMPHLLIAGATGSGKSVCINAILMSFLLTKCPDQLKLIMIDPKMVELSRFKNIPHLMSPVVTDMKRAAGILEWACMQMDQRYEQLALIGVNNIIKFNALSEKEIIKRAGLELNEEELEIFPKQMPYIVLVVDELADLMLVAGKDVEKSIIRLASKSRAVGIHVLLATQRPSVDVITGLIKANMPSRVAFQVASKVDSRTILDSNGAESLLGAGDMLFMPPASSKLIRIQGVFVSDAEVDRVVEHWRNQGEPEYHDELKGAVIGGLEVKRKDVKRDELFDEAVRAVLENQRGSVSLLQRKFGIGYGRASRIIDQMAEAGILGGFREGKAREILMTLSEYENAFFGATSAEEEFESYESDSIEEQTLAGLRGDELEPEQL